MANIGTLAIKLTANPTGLHSALDQAQKKVGQFSGNVSKLLLSPLTGLAKAAAVPGNAIKSFIAPIQSLLTSIPFIGGALAAIPLTGAGFADFIKSGIEDIRGIVLESQKLGISVQAMSGLLYAAGNASEAFVHGMGHMERLLQEASTGSKEATATFQALGLSAEQLSSMAPDQAFMRIAESIKGLSNPMDRAQAAFKIFGKAGLEILPMLGKDLEAAKQRAAELGLVFGQNGAQEIMKAGKALSQIDSLVTGLKRQLAIASAPFIETLATMFTDLITKGPGIKGMISSVVDFALTAIAALADGIADVISLMKDAQSLSATAKGLLNPQTFASTMAGLGAHILAPNQENVAGGLGDKIRELRDRSLKGLNDMGGGGGVGGKPAGAFDEKAFLRAQEIVQGMQGPTGKWLEQTAELNRLFKQGALSGKDWQRAIEDSYEKLKQMVGIQKTPLEQFKQQMELADKLAKGGAVDLSKQLGAQGFLALEKSLGPAAGMKSPAALIEGSAAAYSAITQAENAGVGPQNVQERVAAIMQRALEHQQRHTTLLAEIAKALDQQAEVVGGP